jgi:hypothetical protein
MTEQQLKDRDIFINKLITAKWNPGGWELLFESGANLTPEAQAEYQNPVFDICLSYYAEKGYILMECVKKKNHKTISLRLYPKNDLSTIVDTVIAVQDTFSLDNYPDFINKLVPMCRLVLLQTADGLVKVSL